MSEKVVTEWVDAKNTTGIEVYAEPNERCVILAFHSDTAGVSLKVPMQIDEAEQVIEFFKNAVANVRKMLT